MNEPIISVSGLRGIIGQSLDPVLAIRYAVAYVGLIEQDGPIIVTRDGRTTGSMLASGICSGIAAAGRDVLYGDVAATPTTGVLVRQHKAAGAIQISASHNPPPYNGMKLFGTDGRVIPGDEGEKVITAFREIQKGNGPDWQPHDKIGTITNLESTTEEHLKLVLATVDVSAIKAKKYKVVLDSNHGAGSVLGRLLLGALGCEAVFMGDTPDGKFAHPPEPTEANLESTTKKAVDFGADAVFCQDPDADRLAIIDEKGRYIGEEYTLALTANHRLAKTKGPLVINCSSSRMSADIAKSHGCDFQISAVGEANVTNKMIELKAAYGGEGSGGPIDPRVGFVRDSFVGMAQVLDAMTAGGKTISELVAELPSYEICKTKVPLDRDAIPALMDKLEKQFPDAKANRLDGLRLDWDDKWLLVRPSNTEPIVRAIAEARSMDEAKALCDKAMELSSS